MPDAEIMAGSDVLFFVFALTAAVYLIRWFRRRSGQDASRGAPPTPTPEQSARPEVPSSPIPTPAVESAKAQPHVSTLVHTRTQEGSVVPLTDPGDGIDRLWTTDEDRRLISAYDGLAGISSGLMLSIAREVGVAQIQVARRLIRLTLEPRGDISDPTGAPNDRARYSASTRAELVKMHDLGIPLPEIAGRAGRTQLAVGWQIVELRRPSIKSGIRERLAAGLPALTVADITVQAAMSSTPRRDTAGERKRRWEGERHTRTSDVCGQCFQVRSVSGACGCDA